MKNVLLIAGGGTLGKYTAEELLRLGHRVDIICLEDMNSNNENLKYYKGNATYEFLKEFLSKNRYDGIVNFMHYPEVEDYRPIHKLLSDNCEHLIFLSSYRVYADLQHPITEDAPMLLDVSDDKLFLQEEKYAVSKAKAEKFLKGEDPTGNWTVVRPVISSSKLRFDLFSYTQIVKLAQEGKTAVLPECAKELTAGLDWAGNSGKLIANLLFKKDAIGEAYTVSSGQNLKWSEIADIYSQLVGLKVEYIPTEQYKQRLADNKNAWGIWYDRMYDRVIDNTKILKATGLKKEDFLSVKDGIKIELELSQSVQKGE